MDNANRIKALRVNAGLSQQGVANLLGIPKRTWQNWELGLREPSEWIVRLLEHYFMTNNSEK